MVKKIQLVFSFVFLVVISLSSAAIEDDSDPDDFDMLPPCPEMHLHATKKDDGRVVVSWDAVYNAEEYEICHNCETIVDGEGVRDEDTDDGVSHKTFPHKVCPGGHPCHIYDDIPHGLNHFNVRVRIWKKWSRWSNKRNFYFSASDYGIVRHEEL